MRELKIMNRIELLKTRKQDNSKIICKLMRELKRIRNEK